MEPPSHLPDVRAKTLSTAPPPWTAAPTPEHLQELAVAKTRGFKIRRAYLTARSSAWTLGIFAALTFVCGIGSFSVVGSALGAGMLFVTWVEFKGADQIKRLDTSGPRRLAINQLVLGAMLLVYALYSLLTTKISFADMPSAIGSEAELNSYFPDLLPTLKTAFRAVYIALAVFAILGPGLTAYYYDTRRKYIVQYLQETPAWILELQRAGLSV